MDAAKDDSSLASADTYCARIGPEETPRPRGRAALKLAQMAVGWTGFPELAGQRHTARRPLDRIHRLGYQFIERGVLGGLIRKAAEDVAGE